MSNNENRDQAAADLAAALVQFNEGMTPVIEAAAGYRNRLEVAGFSPSMAEWMAVDYHRHLLGRAFGP